MSNPATSVLVGVFDERGNKVRQGSNGTENSLEPWTTRMSS